MNALRYGTLTVLCITALPTYARDNSKEFAIKLSEFLLIEKELVAIVNSSDPQQREEFKKKLLRSGMSAEQLQDTQSAPKVAPVTLPIAVSTPTAPAVTPPAAPPAPALPNGTPARPPTPQELKDKLNELKKTEPSTAPKVFTPLPGKPTEKELQDAAAKLKSTPPPAPPAPAAPAQAPAPATPQAPSVGAAPAA